MTKPFNKSVSLDERERLFFNDVPSLDDFALRDPPRSGSTCTTAVPWMMGHFLVEREQGGKQRFNSVGDIVECIAATLSTSCLQSSPRRKFRHVYSILQTVSGELNAWQLRRQIFHVTKRESLRMRNTYDAMQKNITGVP